MGLNASQLREFIVRPSLQTIDLHSPAAENLVMGTAAQESHLEYIKQLHHGPAVGLFQMEPATHDDIWINYLHYQHDLGASIRASINTVQDMPSASRLIWDLRYSSIMCRVHYRRVAAPLPDQHDIQALAAYWKQHYNTPGGAGTEQEFVDNYRRVTS